MKAFRTVALLVALIISVSACGGIRPIGSGPENTSQNSAAGAIVPTTSINQATATRMPDVGQSFEQLPNATPHFKELTPTPLTIRAVARADGEAIAMVIQVDAVADREAPLTKDFKFDACTHPPNDDPDARAYEGDRFNSKTIQEGQDYTFRVYGQFDRPYVVHVDRIEGDRIFLSVRNNDDDLEIRCNGTDMPYLFSYSQSKKHWPGKTDSPDDDIIYEHPIGWMRTTPARDAMVAQTYSAQGGMEVNIGDTTSPEERPQRRTQPTPTFEDDG
jgi:hypothetical protein